MSDPAFATREDRKANRLRLRAELETVLTTRPAADWVSELNALGVPSGEVLSVPDVLTRPQIAGRGLIARFDDVPGVGRAIELLRTGVKIDGTAPAVDRPPPVLGQDTDRVLGELGLDAAALRALRADGVI